MKAVRVVPHDIEVWARPGESVVDALRRYGWRSPYKCRRGGCGACRAQLRAGELLYPRAVADSVLSATEQAAGACLPCRAVPLTDVVIDLGSQPLRAVLASSAPHKNPDPAEQEGP
ncbi:hypothetical protein GCM10011609_32930 [Lentzea pudingi]|uniref:2Fe-2S ferredoxin-type domain-containing protein n=1 Tax=Lentzea pudingi TaxID=1789439 RepID=A0ABQ2HYX0_9PSEU|nr:2Fe-2S iron-sulfur cluster-binding protein [Lentzea pudingi]GGM92874.1 hypothetical protein GCM10011609_32930 [Lentzea pudingi]